MTDRQALLQMSMQERVKEAFKRIRRHGFSARMGPQYDEADKLRRKEHYCYIPQYSYEFLNRLKDSSFVVHFSPKDSEFLLYALQSCGLETELRGTTLHCLIKNDLLARDTINFLPLEQLTKEYVAENYQID